MPATVILLNSLQNIEIDEAMSKRRPPTAGTFARLALASAVACAVLPEIVDLSAGIWSRPNAARTDVNPSPGPRVMGSLHTADDAKAGVDRFRFAAGTPFEDEEPRAAPKFKDAAAVDTDELLPEHIAPSPATPKSAQGVGAAHRGDESVDRQVPAETLPKSIPSAPPDQPEQAAVAPAVVEPAPQSAQPPPATVSAPETTAEEKPAFKADAMPVAREKKPAADPQQATRRTGATGRETSRAQRRSAAADGDVSPPKAQWRPDNLTNWPE